MSFIEALKPVPMEVRYKPGKIVSKRFVEELAWYQQYEWEKTTRSRFYQRLYQWWSKEEAIKLVAPIHYSNKPAKFKAAYVRPITPTPKPAANPDYKDIRVKYNAVEAKVFCKEYEQMINDLQNQYYETDDVIAAREINNRLEQLVKEYQTFKLYNGVP